MSLATELRALRKLLNGNTVDNSALITVAKANLLAAINEVAAAATAAAGLDDGTLSTSKAWSSSKTHSEIVERVAALLDDGGTSTSSAWSSSETTARITAALDALIGGAPGAADTLGELSALLSEESSVAAALTTALAARVRFDAAQSLSGGQQVQARTNIGAVGAADVTPAAIGAQALDSDLTTIAGLTPTTDDVIQSVAGAWASRTPAQVKTSLALAKSDVGLGSVDDTADSAKPVSTAQQTALNLKQDTSGKGAASGYAGLDAGTQVPIGQLPTGTSSSTVTIGNDTRLSDARTPTAHKTSHATGGSDALTPTDIGAVANGALVLNVKDAPYGAVGDGVTDDTAAIQAAITAAGSIRAVYFPAATYYCASGLTGTTFTRLVGEGFYLNSQTPTTPPTLKFATTVTVGFTAGDYASIENLRLYGQDKSYGRTGLSSTAAIRLTQVQLYDWGVGWSATDNYYTQAYQLDIQRCATGLYLNGANGCYNFHLYGPTFRNNTIGIDIATKARALNIWGGSIETSGTGIMVRTAAANSLINVQGLYSESAYTGHTLIACTETGAGTNTMITYERCLTYLTEGAAAVDLGTTSATLNGRNNQFLCSSGSSTTPTVYKISAATGKINLLGDDIRMLAKGTYVDGGGTPVATSRPARQLIVGRYYTSDGPVQGTGSGTIMQANWQYFTPFVVEQPHVFQGMGVLVTTVGSAGSVCRFGIYADADAGGPGALVLDAGTVATDVSGLREVAFTQFLAPGLYWRSVAGQGAPTTQPTVKMTTLFQNEYVPMINPGNGYNGGYSKTAVTGAFAANPVVLDATAVPVIYFKA